MARKATPEAERHWHLDRKVPLALIFAILVQTATAFWWASGINAAMTSAQRDIAELRTNPDRITRLETKLEALNDTLRDLKVAVERIGSRR